MAGCRPGPKTRTRAGLAVDTQQGNPVSLDVMPGSNHDSLSDVGGRPSARLSEGGSGPMTDKAGNYWPPSAGAHDARAGLRRRRLGRRHGALALDGPD
jgi:hypothetical protein